MPITTRDRKLLWARAGGTCTLCKRHVTADAKDGDRDVVLGEEAHIVSEEPKGPRYHPMPKYEVDTYANLMLLCPIDHKIIDEQVSYYTEQRLHDLKREHEQWVKERFSSSPPPIKVRDPEPDKPVALQRIDSGKELMNVIAHTLATHHGHPEPRSPEESGLIGAFFQNISDCINIWNDLGPSDRIQAEFVMSEEITRLRDAGFVVCAAIKQHIIEGGEKPPAPWPTAYIVIYRMDDEAIKTNPADKLSF